MEGAPQAGVWLSSGPPAGQGAAGTGARDARLGDKGFFPSFPALGRALFICKAPFLEWLSVWGFHS